MILKKTFYILFIIFPFVGFTQQKEIFLDDYLHKIEVQFNVVFNYQSEIVNNRICKGCFINEHKSLKEHISNLRQVFNLKIDFITDEKIIINASQQRELIFIDAENKTPIPNIFVTLETSKETWTSNAAGKINFKNSIPKKIILSHLSYGKLTLNIDSLKNSTIYLQKEIQNLNELYLYTYFTNGTYLKKDGNFFIKPKKINFLAGQINHDVIKSLENLPQVISNSESISDLIINGGTQDQNLFLWNDIKVYQNHHFFGLISAFNENLISSINLYDNATPSIYGNSTSSVISLTHDTKISKKTKAGFSADFLSMDTYAIIPFSEKSELQFSARKSLTESWKSPTYLKYSKKVFQSSFVNSTDEIKNDDITSNDSFNFYDIQLQYIYKPNFNNAFNINGLYLENNLSYTEEDVFNKNTKKSDLKQKNVALGTNWQHYFLNKSSLKSSFSYSKHSMYGGNFLLSKEISSEEYNSIENFETKLIYKSKPIVTGFDYTFGASYEYLTVINNTTNFNSLYISNLIQKSVLYNVFSAIHYTKNKISSGFDIRNVYYDFLKSNQIEPRFYFTYSILPELNIQLRKERKTQNISQIIDLENNFLGIEKRRWSMANDKLAPLQKSNQLELALILKTSKSIFNIKAYHKEVDGITTNNQGFQNLNQFDNHFGKYKINGIQTHYNFKSKKLNAWFSYNYSVNKYQFENLTPKIFYNNNDIRNSFISGINFKHKGFNIGLSMEYNSGKPYTSINDETPIIEDVFNKINYNNANDKRISNYLRFDTTIGYDFKLVNHVKYKLALGIINIGNRKNILSRYYTLSNDKETIEILDKYGLEFTPNLSLKINLL